MRFAGLITPHCGLFGGRGEEVDKVSVGIAEEDGAVSPRHEGWLLLPLADDAAEPLVLALNVVDDPLDDGGLVTGGSGGVVEQCHL